MSFGAIISTESVLGTPEGFSSGISVREGLAIGMRGEGSSLLRRIGEVLYFYDLSHVREIMVLEFWVQKGWLVKKRDFREAAKNSFVLFVWFFSFGHLLGVFWV